MHQIGLGRDEMADAIAAQVRELAYANPFVDMTNVPAGRLAEKLAELAPGDLNRVFFSSGGSTAIDVAYRLVQFYQYCNGTPEKRHVLSRVDAYHGTTYAAVSIGGKPDDKVPGFNYIDDTIHHLSSPNFYRFGDGRTEQEFADHLVAEFQAKVDELGADQVAAFFAEPIMGSGAGARAERVRAIAEWRGFPRPGGNLLGVSCEPAAVSFLRGLAKRPGDGGVRGRQVAGRRCLEKHD